MFKHYITVTTDYSSEQFIVSLPFRLQPGEKISYRNRHYICMDSFWSIAGEAQHTSANEVE